MELRKLHPGFGVEIIGVDTARPLDAAAFAPIRAAFEEHGLLLFRDQDLDDEKQVAFSLLFGPLEKTISANPAGGSLFARQSNLDIRDGTVIPLADRRMIYQKANYLWHTDSSYKPVPSLCSLLSGRVVPPEGGNTEFADMAAAYDALPEETKTRLDGLVAEHSIVHSRAQIDPNVMTEAEKAEVPPVRQTMVRVNPVTGRKALFIGAHCSHIIGWPLEEGRAFVRHLTETAIRPEICYSHPWRAGDIVVWDNRRLLHRATAYDAVKYKRLMQRTTVAGDAPTVPQ
ncbi:alpha-ketoglutarate-dependent 2,4-dichlorophenoxyacetate dioxygenase [Allostella humosa]|uniref:TauD/TfdA dioxygenase family protein n=1 Tax=Stella humosa TaxID=94 RepID=UPI00113C90EB|nr:TauD/TfdA family dioxygenase [Stella humosa]BBK30717.1 alpha-ketoglutarate-dependent 2,4-dichlorophenoxyacetate dioxygenase [Stella humosa]